MADALHYAEQTYKACTTHPICRYYKQPNASLPQFKDYSYVHGSSSLFPLA
jgi:hypothetical protein